MPLTSPYNFVPINTKVYYPQWRDLVSMDIPFEDGEDGWIEVTLRNVSPLFTRNGARSEKDEKETESSYFIDSEGKKRYFIPGTAIKGMLRGTLEIMAYGKMIEKRHYTNRWFGYRDVGGRTKEKTDYVKTVTNGKRGWLCYDVKEDKYFFEQCEVTRDDTNAIKNGVAITDVKDRFPSYRNDETSVWKINCSLGTGSRPTYPIYTKDDREYRIVCTGAMDNKKHELLFPVNLLPKKEIDKKSIEAFFTVYDATPDFDHFKGALENGDKIPVFLVEDKNLPISPVIGMSKMFKLPFKKSITEMIHNDQNPNKSDYDLCDTMFGVAGGKEEKSLKGRIQVGHAFATSSRVTILDGVTGVLGQPRASYYPLYVKQKDNPYKNYNTDSSMAGRKLYRIHQGGSVTSLPQGNDNENVTTRFYPLAAGQEFKLRINVHNLKRVEIGALLSALTLHETNDAFHNIGMAKGYGYGKLQITGLKLNGFKSEDRRYYEVAFEDEMNDFVSQNILLGLKWCETEAILDLANILREHNDDTVRMMELTNDDKSAPTYEYYKSDINFKGKKIEVLSEAHLPVANMTRDIDEMRESLINDIKAARALKYEDRLEEALQAIDAVIKQFEEKGLCHSPESRLRSEILAAMATKEEEARKAELAKQQQAQADAQRKEELAHEEGENRKRRIQAGLAALLDEMYDDGPNKGQYKVTTVKTCFSKVKLWLKTAERALLDEQEQADLKHTLERIMANPDKSERRDLKKFGNKLWHDVINHLGEDVATQLYEVFKGTSTN